MNTQELEDLKTRLKCGEYTGVDIMNAQIAIEELLRIYERIESLEIHLRRLETLLYSNHASGRF